MLKNRLSQQTGSEYRPKRYQTKQQQKSHSKTILLLQGLRSLSLDEQNDWTKIGHKIKSDRQKNQKSNTINILRNECNKQFQADTFLNRNGSGNFRRKKNADKKSIET